MKKYILISLFLMSFIFSFSATIKAIDGNTLTKAEVLKIENGKAYIKSGFLGETIIPLDNIMYISFDDSISDINGILIDKYNMSGYVKEYSLKDNTATVTTTSGEFLIKDLSVLRYWNIRQNTIANENKKEFNSKMFNLNIGNKSYYYGDIVNIKNNIINFNVDGLGLESIPLENINNIYRYDYEDITDYSIQLSNDLIFKYKSLELNSDKIKIELSFGSYNTNLKYIKQIKGSYKEIKNGDYYFILNNNIRFFADIKEFNEKELTIITDFSEHKIPNENVISFMKLPKMNKMIIANSDEVLYGEYTKSEKNISFKNSTNKTDINNIKILSSEKVEYLKDEPKLLYTLKTNTESKVINLGDNKLYIDEDELNVYSLNNYKKENQLNYNLDFISEILEYNGELILKNLSNNIFYTKYNKNYDFSSDIINMYIENNTLYILLKNGEFYSLNLDNEENFVLIKKYSDNILYIKNKVEVYKDGQIYLNSNKIQSLSFNINNILLDDNTLFITDHENNIYLLDLANNKIQTLNVKNVVKDITVSSEYLIVRLEEKILILNKESLDIEKTININSKIYNLKYKNSKIYVQLEKELLIYEIFE